MRKLLAAGLVAVVMSIGPIASSDRADAATVQALEQALREAREMGLSGPQIDQMQEMLDALRADEARRGVEPETRGMQPNHFDTLGARAYSDCDLYIDNQAYTFCSAAVYGYLQYMEVYANQGDSDAALQIWDAHADTVENLVNYVDNFMTAECRGSCPRR